MEVVIDGFEGETPIKGLLSPFARDVNVLVRFNHELTIQAIDKREEEWIAEAREKFDDQEAESIISDDVRIPGHVNRGFRSHVNRDSGTM